MRSHRTFFLRYPIRLNHHITIRYDIPIFIMMLPSTNLLSLIILFVSTFIVPAHAKECRAIMIRWIHEFEIGPQQDCNYFCDHAALSKQFSQVLKTDDACQRDSGFSTFQSIIFAFFNDKGVKHCMCGIKTEAQRVAKTNPLAKYLPCDPASYAKRITQRPSKQFNSDYYSEWEVTRENVRCQK